MIRRIPWQVAIINKEMIYGSKGTIVSVGSGNIHSPEFSGCSTGSCNPATGNPLLPA